jgi:hypothetical protein
MNYPISQRPLEAIPLQPEPRTEELILNAIAVVIEAARSQGQSLEDVKSEVLADDAMLEPQQRKWLSDVVSQVWESSL